MINMNKKGFIASYIVDFYAYLIFVAIVIIFLIILSFSASPVEKSLTTQEVSADSTIFLIKTLQTPTQINGKTITPAEIVSTEDLTRDKEFSNAIGTAIQTTYPQKNNIQYFWLRVYAPGEIPTDLTKYAPNYLCSSSLPEREKYFTGTTGLSYGHLQTEGQLLTRLNIPIKNRIDYAIIVLCVGKYYFT